MNIHVSRIVLSFIAVALLCNGCDKQATPPAKSGKTSPATEEIAAKPKPTVRSKPAAELLVGTWNMKPEFDETKQNEFFDSIENEQEKAIMKAAFSSMKDMSIQMTINADGTYESAQGLSNKGTWKVVSEDGDDVVWETTNERAHKESHSVKFVSDDKITQEETKPFPLTTVYTRATPDDNSKGETPAKE